MSAAEIANRILEAYQSGVPIAPVRTEISGLAAAYATVVPVFSVDDVIMLVEEKTLVANSLTGSSLRSQSFVSFYSPYDDLLTPQCACEILQVCFRD